MRRAAVLGLCLAGACGGPRITREQVEMLFAFDARLVRDQVDPVLAARGAALFATPRPGGGTCTDCHPLDRDGQDGRRHGRDTPALRDAGRHLLHGWGGEFEQLSACVRRELELRSGACAEEDVEAITAFLRSWRSRGRWDRFVEGDDAALDADEREGLATFVLVGCAACHGGRLLGGRSRHKLGAVEQVAARDQGLAETTGRPADRGMFRAPALRLAARTGPYLHDGSIADLEHAIDFMARHELGRTLDARQRAAIAVFLRAAADLDAATHVREGDAHASPQGR